MTEAQIEPAIESMFNRCTGSGSASAFGIVEAQPIREAPERFPDWTPAELVEFLCRTHAGCSRDTEVARIEWRYLDAAPESDRTGEKDLPRRGRPTGGMQWPS